MLEKNNSIAKNTLILYFRMFLIMGVQLYTVRIVLETLGSSDYGLNNVVGGVVSMFSFLSNTMSNASQRFFSYEIGRGNAVQLKKIFSLTLIIYCILGLTILILAETVGLWFLNYKMIIPPERIVAANYVYQFSILGFIFSMFQVPYDAIIIAREKMNVYAYVGIIQVILRLVIVYLLVISPCDKLITYSFFILMITILITTINKVYCLKNFKESHFQWYWNKIEFKEIISYSGWNLFGALAGLGNNQGINIVLNLFFGPVVNASRAIAFQVNTSINGFVQNFMTATRPQIIKNYSKGNINEMLKLVFQSSKFSFYLLFIVSLPLLIHTKFILHIWLGDFPSYTVYFTRMIIMTTLVDTMAYSLITAAQATGKIKRYQMIVGGCLMLNVPISYIFFKLGYSPELAFNIAFVNAIICLYLRLYLLKLMIGLSIIDFFKKVIFKILLVCILVVIPVYLIHSEKDLSLIAVSVSALMIVLWTCIAIYFVGTDSTEKLFLKTSLHKLRKKIF